MDKVAMINIEVKDYSDDEAYGAEDDQQPQPTANPEDTKPKASDSEQVKREPEKKVIV